MNIAKSGDIVTTKHGEGRVRTINHTYSIPLYLIELDEGKFEGETLALTELELKR